jgi:two-component system response regulator YesN
MWQAMIVDDEPIIRFGIKASVNWEQEGIEVVADCANGAEALQVMKQRPVHILITDIKMPIMDGLALTRHALELNEDLKVILVSSYNDFEYVREGLKLGVIDYILKHTLEPEELLSIIRRCTQQMEQKAQAVSQVTSIGYDSLIDQRRHYENELKLYLIDAADRLADGDYPLWLNSTYTACCIRLNSAPSIEEQHGYLYRSILLDQCAETLYEEATQGLAIQTAENELLFLMPYSHQQPNPIALIEKGIKHLLAEDGTIAVMIGCAESSAGVEVRQVVDYSKQACDRGFFEGSGVYRFQSEAAKQRHEGSHLPELIQGETSLDDERLYTLVEHWRADWEQGGCSPRMLKEQACRVLSIKFKQHSDPHALVEAFDRLFKSETLTELCELLKQSIIELHKARIESTELGTTHHPINQALHYIDMHYLEAMTLQQVADYVHVSKNYLSILFKKVTGQNFIDYVIMLRIVKAKEMLAGTSYKVYEIAEKSGFNDVKYFSKLFKKMTGYTPIDYRDYCSHSTADSPARKGE